MRKLKTAVISFAAFAIVAFFHVSAKAQTIEEAGEVFNNAIQLMQTDLPAAITQFENCIAICEKIGDEGNDLKTQSRQQIPGLHYNHALAQYNDKNYEGAIRSCELAINTADEFENPDIKAKATSLIAQLYFVKGNDQLKAKDFDNANASFDKALEYDADFSRAYYGKMMVYREQENYPLMEEAFKKMIEKSGEGDDVASKTQVLMSRTFSVAAAKAIKANNSSEALAYADKAIEYGDNSANTYYYKTLAANMEKKWDTALEAARKALELEQKDKNKIHFEMGKAFEGKGSADEACAAYKLVVAGPYVQNAQYQMKQVLKCK